MTLITNCKELEGKISEAQGVHTSIDDKESQLIIVYSGAETESITDGIACAKIIQRALLNNKHIDVSFITNSLRCLASRRIILFLTKFGRRRILEVDNIEKLTFEDIVELSHVELSEEELAQFVGYEIAAYPRIEAAMNELVAGASKSSADALNAINKNKDLITALSKFISLTGEMLSDDLNHIELNRQTNSAASEITELQSKIYSLSEELNIAQSERDAMSDKLHKMTLAQITNPIVKQQSEVVGTEYLTLSLDKFVNIINTNRRPAVKNVLYFKEVSYARYANTFILMLMKHIQRSIKVSVRCIIFDENGFDSIRYNGLEIATAKTYDALESSKKLGNLFVADGVARNILDDSLMKYEVVIIYDRLNRPNDIIEGRRASKFIVVNGMKDLEAVHQAIKIENDFILSSFGTSRSTLSVRGISDFKARGQASRLMTYSNMKSTIDLNKTVFDIVLENTGINRL